MDQPCLAHLHGISLVPQVCSPILEPDGRADEAEEKPVRRGTKEMGQHCPFYLHVVSLVPLSSTHMSVIGLVPRKSIRKLGVSSLAWIGETLARRTTTSLAESEDETPTFHTSV